MKKFYLLFLYLFFTTSFANNNLSLALDWYINPNHAPILIAQANGYFAEQKLDVEIIEPADPSDPPKFVASNKVDLAITYQPQLVIQQEHGLPLTQVGTLIATPLDSMMYLQDSEIHSAKDLKGKRIGYSNASTGLLLINQVLAAGGLTQDDVELINVHYNLVQSLLMKKVDIVSGAMRNIEPIEISNHGAKPKLLLPEDNGFPVYSELIFVTNKENDNDEITRFLKAIAKASLFITNHPEQAWQLAIQQYPQLNTEQNKQIWFATIPYFALRPNIVDTSRLDLLKRFIDSNTRPGQIE